jgi:3,4-dihydroxy 2-butanone 4-phosphate synthase/GTP cyclohydrolase II
VLIARSALHGRVDLPGLLRRLLELGIKSVMVEGGARVITSFLTERLIDQMVVTVVPQLVGGVRAFDGSATNDGADFPRLVNMRYEWLDGDMMLWGEPRWE